MMESAETFKRWLRVMSNRRYRSSVLPPTVSLCRDLDLLAITPRLLEAYCTAILRFEAIVLLKEVVAYVANSSLTAGYCPYLSVHAQLFRGYHTAHQRPKAYLSLLAFKSSRSKNACRMSSSDIVCSAPSSSSGEQMSRRSVISEGVGGVATRRMT